jgi:hypothetical protein
MDLLPATVDRWNHIACGSRPPLTAARAPSRGLMNLPDRIQQTILAAMGMKATNASL